MKIFKVRNVKTPTRGTSGSAGIDFYIPENSFGFPGRERLLLPGQDVLIPSGLVIELDTPGCMLMIDNKSGRATKDKLIVGAKIVDEDYRGEVHLHVINVGTERVLITPGEKIVQGIIVPIIQEEIVEVFNHNDIHCNGLSERGTGGFGSTGIE